MQLSIGEVASSLGASCEAPGRLVSGYSIDSRSIASGSLFFAIRGRRFDGHQFVAQALERGAVGAVVEQGFPGASPAHAGSAAHSGGRYNSGASRPGSRGSQEMGRPRGWRHREHGQDDH